MVRGNGNADRITRILSGIGITLAVAAIIAVSAEWRRIVIFMSIMEKSLSGFEHVSEDVSRLEETLARYNAERPLLVERFQNAVDGLREELKRLEQMIISGLAKKPPEWLKKELDNIRAEDKRGTLEDQRLQQQIDRLEAEVFFSKRKPPLQPYAGE